MLRRSCFARQIHAALACLGVCLVAITVSLGTGVSAAIEVPAEIPTAGLTTTASPPGTVCPQSRHNGEYVGVAWCDIRSSSWSYYQAYVTQSTFDCSQAKTSATFRMQILARRGATGVHIAGLWVVYNDGPKRFSTLQFSALDGNNASRNGAWNYSGNYNKDIADLYSLGDNPSRYPGLSPTHYAGLAWGRIGTAQFIGQLRVADNPYPYLSEGSCGFFPVRVMFRP